MPSACALPCTVPDADEFRGQVDQEIDCLGRALLPDADLIQDVLGRLANQRVRDIGPAQLPE